MTAITKYPLGMHNTYWPSFDDAVTQDRGKRSKVHPFMVPLLKVLQIKRPNWEFVATGAGSTNYDGNNDAAVLHSDFDIYDNGEKLASLTREHRNGPVYSVKSHRISAARQRGTWKFSKNLKDITGVILKNVYPSTITEIADRQYRASTSAANGASYKARNEYTRIVSKLSEPALRFLTPQWDAFMAVSDKDPGVAAAKEKLFAAHDDAQASKAFMGITPHWMVVERPRDVIVKPSPDKPAYTCSLESLPDQVKMALGLLKMADKDMIINDIGIRTDTDTFYILYDEEA